MANLEDAVGAPRPPGTAACEDGDCQGLRWYRDGLLAEQDTSARLCGDARGL
jgi:hypothetical protein